MNPSRREVLAGLAATATTIATTAAEAEAVAVAPTAGLKNHATRAGMIYGAAIAEAFDVADYRTLYEAETAIVTTDLALKFGSLRPASNLFEFGPADAIVGWARSSGLLVRGHTLIWNDANPDWLKRRSASEIERIFDEHIERVVSRYAGRIHTWDVVNEPFWPDSGRSGGYRPGPWYDALGPGYIARALKRVRSIDPKAKLCINEAQCEIETGWGKAIRPCLAQLVVSLRHDGVPLDVVGLQGHLQPHLPHNDAQFAAFLATLASYGLDLHITEFDVNDASYPDAIEERDLLVASRASAFLNAALAEPAVKMLVTWELADKWSYYERDLLAKDPTAIRLPRPLPYDDDAQRKLMWSAMAKAFDKRAARLG